MNKRFLVWWLVVVMQLIGFGIAIWYGAISFLIEHDITKLSFAIIMMWLVATTSIGYRSFKGRNDFETPWFLGESCMTVGMVGTVIGFMLMLGSSFTEIDPNNVESMKRVIVDMAGGMSTALLTTLCGLVASLFVKVQIILEEQEYGK
jgi:hypothetical protein